MLARTKKKELDGDTAYTDLGGGGGGGGGGSGAQFQERLRVEQESSFLCVEDHLLADTWHHFLTSAKMHAFRRGGEEEVKLLRKSLGGTLEQLRRTLSLKKVGRSKKSRRRRLELQQERVCEWLKKEGYPETTTTTAKNEVTKNKEEEDDWTPFFPGLKLWDL